MKTTVEIPDALLIEVKRVAAATDTTMKELVEAGLYWVVTAHGSKAEPFKLRRATFRGEGFQEGIREGSWEELRALAYEGRGG